METNSNTPEGHGKASCAGMKWTDIKQFQHRYIVDIPTNLEKHLRVEAEIPSPIFDPVQIKDYNWHRGLFKVKPKLDSRLAYFKKLYAKTNRNLLKKTVTNKQEYVTLPQYVVDIACGAFEDNDDHPWCYTGGTLDCISFNNHTYLAHTLFQHNVQVADLSESSEKIDIQLNEDTPIYSLKSISYDQDALLAVRQKSKLSLFCLSDDDDDHIKTELMWKNKTISSFVDMNLNNFKRNEIAALDFGHNLKIKDFTCNKSVANYSFETDDFSGLNDHFGQIMYLDCNTIAFINRCCFYLLDLRSLNTQTSCLNTSWLKCDSLCTFNSSTKDANYLYISSLHNLANFDVRNLKSVNQVTHMMAAAPFISTCVADDDGEYICLTSQHPNDKVFLYSCTNSLTTPKYIPSTKDALTAASLTKRLNISNHLEERLSFPTLGMKLWKSNGTVNIFVSNSVGDVFRQSLLPTKPDNANSLNKLAQWSNNVSKEPKPLEATSICNLSNIMHNVSSRFSEAKLSTAFMQQNHSQQEFEKEFAGLTKYLESSVGEAMNSIWDVEDFITENNVNGASEISSKCKVSEWLASTG